MSTLDHLNIRDLRPELDVLDRPLCRRPRSGRVQTVTLHYNGPRVPSFGRPEQELHHVVTVDVPNHQARIGADSLMYHIVILSDGSIWQTRSYELQAWHCGNYEGNEHSIAVHLPLGGDQDATEEQWAATTQVFDALIADHGLAGRQAVRAHREWSSTLCPGPFLMARLQDWRSGTSSLPGIYRVREDVGWANIRQGPGRQFPVALEGTAVMWPGDLLEADAVVAGETIGHEPRWAHRRDGLGFVHLSLLSHVGVPA